MNLQEIQYYLCNSRHSVTLHWCDQYCLCGPARSFRDHGVENGYYFNQGRLKVFYSEEPDWDASHEHYWYPRPSVHGKCTPEPRSSYSLPHRRLKTKSRVICLPPAPYPPL